jgi:hypothetical protein
MWVNASSSDWNCNHCYRVVSPVWGTHLKPDCNCNCTLFPSVFTCQYHSYSAPQTSSKCSSYQKDKWAKLGSLPKINALSGIGVHSSPASFPLLHRPNSPHAITLPSLLPTALPSHLTNAVSTGDRSRATSTAVDQFSGNSRLLRRDPVPIYSCSSLQSVTDQTTHIFVKPAVITTQISHLHVRFSCVSRKFHVPRPKLSVATAIKPKVRHITLHRRSHNSCFTLLHSAKQTKLNAC